MFDAVLGSIGLLLVAAFAVHTVRQSRAIWRSRRRRCGTGGYDGAGASGYPGWGNGCGWGDGGGSGDSGSGC